MKENKQKDEKINELKNLKPYGLKKNEKLIIFIIQSMDQEVNHPFICKNIDKFKLVELQLYIFI